jgi:hypothetical protein
VPATVPVDSARARLSLVLVSFMSVHHGPGHPNHISTKVPGHRHPTARTNQSADWSQEPDSLIRNDRLQPAASPLTWCFVQRQQTRRWSGRQDLNLGPLDSQCHPSKTSGTEGMASLYGDSALSGHVGTAIQPSVLLVAAWVVLGVVTSPFVAARAVRAAITASRASSKRRHLSS